MTRSKLPATRDHLADNRRLIIGRSLAAAIAGGIPVPVLEEWLEAKIQRGTIRRIAQSRVIDVDKEAVVAIAGGRSRGADWAEVAGSGLAMRLFGKSIRRLLVAVVAARRARAAAKNYAVASLFDHYCAKLHVGLGLDAQAGAEVRKLIDQAIAETRGSLGVRPFRRGISGAMRAGLRAPTRVVDLVTGGRASRLLRRAPRRDEVEVVRAIDTSIERARNDRSGILARMTAAVELELSAEQNPYLERLIARFERLWRAQVEPAAP
ncbi:MAG TPA: hypothetical protein VFG83_18150 [Kofleriaceae bacterium]|nr:hypothetical protein [Kofleriaceae bacterium]